MTLQAYTDGSCRKSRAGGWAVLVDDPIDPFILRDHAADTTNNRMELSAVVEALRHTPSDTEVRLVVDSKYVQMGATRYLSKWVKNGFITQTGDQVKNVDLWREFKKVSQGRKFRIDWVKGHRVKSQNLDCVKNCIVDANAQKMSERAEKTR